MGKLFKLAMFITSFIPLWLTVIFIDILNIINNHMNLWTEYISIVTIIVLNAFSILVLFKSMASIQSTEYNSYKVIEAIQEKGITSEFLLSYVLPLFAFEFTQWDGVVQFLIYFIILAFLCIRNNNVYANLILEIKKYKFYDCELQWKPEPSVKPIKVIVLSKENLCSQIGNTIEVASLNKPFHLMKNLEE
ncbi:MAG: hypothetical protein GX587_03150 [Bacteroidales bacterium]|jgi:hypothetical protein|nr:hypothetical protein [Bacteroidales bacterium]